MKDRLAVREDRAAREKFIPCETDTYGGVNHGGTTCAGGLRIYAAPQFSDRQRKAPMYGAVPQREARTCECMLAWRSRNPRTS